MLRRLKTSTLARSILAVATGTAAGQAVTFAFSPVITRLYDPETFGLQGVFLSLVSILSPIIALRYPTAIIVAEDESEARYLGRLAMAISLAISCLLSFVLMISQDAILKLLGVPLLGDLIWFLPLALFCVSLQDVANFHASREGRFRRVGIANVFQAFIANLGRVLGGLIAPVAGVLVAVTSLAPATQAAVLGFQRSNFGVHTFYKSGDRERMRVLLRKYSDFPLYRAPTDILNSASQSVPVLMLAALFSPAVAGLYTLTRSVLNLPTNLVYAAIGNVLYARFAELSRAGIRLSPLLRRSTLGLAGLVPFIIGSAWFAPPLFSFAFGQDWLEAGYYARWMALWIATGIVSVPATRIVPVIKRQGALMILNAVLLIVRILTFVIAYWFSVPALTAVAWFSVASAAMMICHMAIFMWFTLQFDNNGDRPVPE